MLTASMSKSDLSSLKQRLGAQWKMNRLRLVHGLRYSFHHMCVTEGLGSATLCPIDMYDRVQTDAECILTMSKKEVMQLFGRPGRMFSWTQLVRSAPLPPPVLAARRVLVARAHDPLALAGTCWSTRTTSRCPSPWYRTSRRGPRRCSDHSAPRTPVPASAPGSARRSRCRRCRRCGGERPLPRSHSVPFSRATRRRCNEKVDAQNFAAQELADAGNGMLAGQAVLNMVVLVVMVDQIARDWDMDGACSRVSVGF